MKHKKAMTQNVVNILLVTIAMAVLLLMVALTLRGKFDGILGIKWF